MEIISSPVSNIRQKISNNNDDHETDQHSTDTTFEFKFDHHHLQSANSNPDSPDSPFKDSPADHLFKNGILLPHSFPVQPMYYYYGSERRSYNYQRSASRTSSIGSKDSFITSRSNSTNSRSSTSSCSSSARTSVSDTTNNLDRKHLYNNAMRFREYHKKRPQPAVLDHAYGSSRRWQFITPMPVMTHDTISSRPKKQKPQAHVTSTTKKKTSASCSWPILRFVRYLITVCRECHALEPSVRSVSSIHEITRQ